MLKTRKEQKEEYKQMKFPLGVFQIRNTVNNKIYVESSIDLNAIWNRHRLQLNFGNHPNTELQKDWKELGEAQFRYEILEEIEQKDPTKDYAKEARVLEQMYIEELLPFDEKGYNRRPKK